ncbi:unnamed protein product, partial [Lepidochelys olivacea]
MKLQIVAAILLVTILSPKRSSAHQDVETPFEEAISDVETPFEEAVSDVETPFEEAVSTGLWVELGTAEKMSRLHLKKLFRCFENMQLENLFLWCFHNVQLEKVFLGV